MCVSRFQMCELLQIGITPEYPTQPTVLGLGLGLRLELGLGTGLGLGIRIRDLD